MAAQMEKSTGSNRYWTNERHMHFLDSIEASFVRSVLGINHRRRNSPPHLDRYLPDSSDSTLDLVLLKKRRCTLHSTSGYIYYYIFIIQYIIRIRVSLWLYIYIYIDFNSILLFLFCRSVELSSSEESP